MPTWRARVVSPVGPERASYLGDAVVRVEGRSIAYVGPYRGETVDADLREGVLVPGFVDAHLHYPQTRIVGSATGPLLQWLAQSTFPEEARFADIAHAEAVAALFARTLAASGTTLSMVYGSVHYEAANALFAALDRRGLKAIAGPVLMDEDCPPELRVSVDAAMEALETLEARWHGADDGRLQLAVVPRFALSCSREMMKRAGRLAAERELWVTTHLAETLAECAVARERFGTADYLQVYEDCGLLHARSVFAHCIHLSEAEWDRMAQAGAIVAHCPDSNAFLGSGNMPVTEVMTRGIPMAIGTDVAAGRSFRIPRILSSAYDNGLVIGQVLSPERLLWWGTRGGALALGHEETGAIEAGLEADLVWVDVPPWAHDLQSVLAAVLFNHDAPMNRRTWVRGQLVWDRDAATTPGVWGR